ncbi:glycine--tRNA ligase subunit beta [Vulgatibacter incomptus]|uniref:Glycine--tRNA ligase beta subunit n=1 Tax=Vulgatibacter incomptus TaxID=1391653 RepID=A0A0K1PDD2_9BACT|nr:glycine--tRNA ligase subunit beta [Vulgatibacter incomptus]AKU91530.1 Glycyl-tRNA synthetase beta chain [Vulgatibacter incomptus]
MAGDLLLEIGTEEIPAAFFPSCLQDLERLIVEGLAKARLGHGTARTFGTPRRLAVWIRDVAEGQEDVSRDELGPPVKAAYDADGNPTKAALSFAQKTGVDVAKLERRATPKGEYLCARVEERGLPALEVLPGVLLEAVRGISWRKTMRWGDVQDAYARPLHWILTRFGDDVVPLRFAEVDSGGVTFGHRFLSSGPIEIGSPARYVEALRAAEVIVDPVERREAVRKAATAGAAEAGGALLADEELVEHVTWLVERPSHIVGGFDPAYLELPREVLVSEMKGHQKYFSVTNSDATALLPAFVAIANTPVKDPALARRGFERVLNARLSDGRFFFDEDRKVPLVDRVERLGKVTFQHKLGSILDKVERFRADARWLAEALGLDAAKREHVERAATLAKADLVTGMVGEFPELQGAMGREYALASGEPEEVARAIFEHYLPRGAGDVLPSSEVGAVVGIADRIDTIAGIFGIGKPPTGAADPFALRRACLGIVHVVLHAGFRFSLAALVDQALSQLEGRLTLPAGEVRGQVLDFFRARLKNLWSESHPAEVVEAVLAVGFDDVVAARDRVAAVAAMLADERFRALAEGFSRTNIVEKAGAAAAAAAVDATLFEKPAEGALYERFVSVRDAVEARLASGDYLGGLRELTALREPLDTFFLEVMVMAEDPRARGNRLRLLGELRELFGRIADFGRMDLKKAAR